MTSVKLIGLLLFCQPASSGRWKICWFVETKYLHQTADHEKFPPVLNSIYYLLDFIRSVYFLSCR